MTKIRKSKVMIIKVHSVKIDIYVIIRLQVYKDTNKIKSEKLCGGVFK